MRGRVSLGLQLLDSRASFMTSLLDLLEKLAEGGCKEVVNSADHISSEI